MYICNLLLPYTGISLRVIVNNTIILLVTVDPDDIHVFFLSQGLPDERHPVPVRGEDAGRMYCVRVSEPR